MLIKVRTPDDRAPEVAADLTADLRKLLQELETERVDFAEPDAAAPEGSKGPALEWAQLVVGFSGGLPSLVDAIRHWVSSKKGTGNASVEIRIACDSLVLRDASPEQQERLVELFLERHS
jgi:hypothetical protein